MISRSKFLVQPFVILAFLATGLMALGNASCDKNSPANADEASSVVKAIDDSEKERNGEAKPAQTGDEPDATKPIPGVDISGLDEDKTRRFYTLVGKTLQSPCGKAHSLRTSLTDDQSCRRAPFAVRAVVQLLEDEAVDKDITDWYKNRYIDVEKKEFKLGDHVPHTGPVDAPVQLVEFYDYGCPACKEFKPLLEEVAAGFPTDVAVFYKQYPLPGHAHSKPAAQAALAAWKLGKFQPMHDLLFAKPHQHQMSDLVANAKSIGLDVANFEKVHDAAVSQVEADVAEGEAAGVNRTPTLFVNGVQYPGPYHPRYLRMVIEEELAVNR